MAKDAQEVLIASNGAIYLGDVGATVETDPDDAPGNDLTELGYATQDGVSFSDTPEVLEIMAWQAARPIRRKTQGRATSASVSLQQWNPDSFSLAFGGGEWAAEGGGVYRFDPPDIEDALPEYTVVIDFEDGDRKNRLVFPKASVSGGVETTLNRQGEAVLPITFELLEPEDDDTLPWNLYSNDPAFAGGS
jgi:hypothetical protein